MRRDERKRQDLFNRIAAAREVDNQEYRAAQQDYRERQADWQSSRELAEKILAGDPESYVKAVEELDPFGELGDFGSRITCEVSDPRIAQMTLHVYGEDIVPKDHKSLLKSGKLSLKRMPMGRFYELYQDYVCSAVLRVASNVLAILPVEIVVSTAVDQLLNAQTGHLEVQAILSAAIPRRTLEQLDLEMIDPSDSMRNFLHRMDFKKTKGFRAVERITHSDLALS